MKSHEYADIFPLMNAKEFKELKEDIKANGLMDTIVTHDGKILDGRNRFNACKEMKVEPKFTEYKGDNPLQYVMSTNLKRRNLTGTQKAVVGRKYKKVYAIWARKRQGHRSDISEPVHISERASNQAGEQVGVSGRYIDMAEEVIEKKPEMEEKLMAGEIKLKTAYREIKLEEQKKEIEELKEATGEYDVIVIDPPWDYGTEEAYDSDNFRGTTPYPSMSLGEIKKIKLPTKDNCVLWLWTTNKFLLEMKGLLEEWGFEIKSILTWDKEIMGIGRWLRSQTEHCILAVKGKPYWKNTRYTTIIKEKRTSHSTKPEAFYKLVEDCCAGRKLDYFARKERKGWDVYGDEVK